MAESDVPTTVPHLTRRMRESAARIRKHREQMAAVAREARDNADANNGGGDNQS